MTTLLDTYKAIRAASARLCLMREDARHTLAIDAQYIAAIDDLWKAAERVSALCEEDSGRNWNSHSVGIAL